MSATHERKRYPNCRQSGIAWVGTYPSHWEIIRLKYVGRLKGGTGFPEEDQGIPDEELPFYKVSDMNLPGNEQTMVTHQNSISRETARRLGATVFPENSIVFPKVGAALLTNKRRILSVPACIDNNTMALAIATGEVRYWYYRLLSLDLARLANPGAVPSLNENDATQIAVALPPVPEQRAIAAFLDRETEQIDGVIGMRERLVALLEEKCVALINNATTKGLDPAAPVKDSGVPWLGMIPAHWDVRRLKYAARLESGHTPRRSVAEYWECCTTPWVTLNDVGYLKDHDYICETTNLISEEGLAHSSARVLPAGTVILSRDATVGRCGILGRPMATSQHFVDWVCGPDLIPEYLLLVFRGPMQQEFESLTNGATITTIGMPDVNEFRVPLPPIAEQRVIVERVSRGREQMGAVIAKTQEQLRRLREYREAVITAAVTGQIDVREGASA